MSSGGTDSSASSYFTVHTGESFNPSETSIADLASSSDGSSVLDDSYGESGATSSSSDSSGFLGSSGSSSSSSSLSYNDSTADSSDRRVHRKKMRALRRTGGDTDSEASSISVGDHTLVMKRVPEGEKLVELLKKIYKQFAPEKKGDAEKIASHFFGREVELVEALGLKYGFNVEILEMEEESLEQSEAKASNVSTKVSDYYEEVQTLGESMQKSHSGYYKDMCTSGVKIQRTIVYPTLTLTIAMECTRAMQCYILAKKKVNGVWYEVGKTNTLHCKPGLNHSFNKTLEVMYHVGIDNGQTLLLEVMDGDHLFVGSGYYFGCVQMSMSDLQQNSYSKMPVNRSDKDDLIGIDLCTLHIQTELDTEGQRLTPKTTDPLKIAFYRQTPPTLNDFRIAFPTFTDTFGTYILSISTKGIASHHSIDPAVLSSDNTRMYLKFLLNDPTGNYSDIEKDPDALECVWQSSKAMDTGTKGKHHFNVFCPVTKIEHILLAGSRNIDDHGDDNRKLIIHLYAEGLNTKDSHSGPRLLSYSEIMIKDLIAEALNTAVGTEEVDVEERILSKRNRGKAIKLHLRQVENLTSKKYREEHENKRKFEAEARQSSLMGRMSIAVTQKVSTALSGDMFLGKEDDYDSMEDELHDVVKRPPDEIEKQKEKSKMHKNTSGKAVEFRKSKQSQMTRRLKSLRLTGKTDVNQGAVDEDGHKHGTVTIRIGRVEVEVKTTSGDEVYEDKLRKKFKPVLKKWLKDNGENFNVACDAQSALTMRSTLDTEFLLDEGADKGMQCAMIVDMNAACTQHVQYKVNQEANHFGADATEESFKQSYVKDAMKVVCRQLSWFSKNRPLRVFAGGGVNPPGTEHPSRNFSRSRAFPLCQEVLLSREEATSASQQIALPLCGYMISDPRAEVRKNIQKRADPRGDLHAAMDLDDPVGLAKRYASWKGYNYNVTQRYYNHDDITAGFFEACTLYEPSVLTKESLTAQLNDQGHIRMESEAPSVTHSKGSEEIRQRQKKLMEIEHERQNWKIRFQAANVGTTQDLESSDLTFYGDIPGSMQYDFIDILDISTVEALIHKDDAKRPVLKEEEFTEDGEVKEDKDWWGGKISARKVDRKAVVWMLGTCPSEQVLHRLGTVIEEQILHPHLPLLVIVIAAETRFDLPQTNAAAVNVTAEPWAPLIACFTAAIERARKKQLARRSRRKAKMGQKYVPSTLDDMLAMYLEKEAKLKGDNGHKLVTSPSHNLALAHFLTWAEVVAGAFVEEDEAMRIRQLTGMSDADDTYGGSADSGEPEEHNIKLPKTKTLRGQMKSYLPSWSIDAIIGRVQIDAEASDAKRKKKNLAVDELNAAEETEAMERADGSYDTSAVPMSDDIETKTDISALTQPTVNGDEKVGADADGASRSLNIKPSRSNSLAIMRDRAKTGFKSFVNLVTGKGNKEKRNVAAPSLYASDRVSGFDELTDMKTRFDNERCSAFEKEMHTLLGSYVMLHSKLDEGHTKGEDENNLLMPYNHEMRELMHAGADNEKQEEACIII